MVSPGNGITHEIARKSLNDKLETVVLNSPKKDEEMSLKTRLRNGVYQKRH